MSFVPKYIVIHCSDVSENTQYDQFQSINNYHRDVKQFPKSSLGYYVGYSWLVTGNRIIQCRLDTEEQAHCNQGFDGKTVYQPTDKANWPKGVISMNFQSTSICWAGDGDIEYPSSMHYALLQQKVWELQDKYNIPNDNVYYHRAFSPSKTCPGSLLDDKWLKTLLVRPTTPITPPKPIENMCIAEEKEINELKEQLSWFDRILSALFRKN